MGGLVEKLTDLALHAHRHPYLARDLWTHYRVDIRRVWSGEEDPGWVLGFVELVFLSDQTVTSARMRGGADWSPPSSDTSQTPPEWVKWVGYTEIHARLDSILASKIGKQQDQTRFLDSLPKIRPYRGSAPVRSDKDATQAWAQYTPPGRPGG